jgi:PRTRC genetic system protein B
MLNIVENSTYPTSHKSHYSLKVPKVDTRLALVLTTAGDMTLVTRHAIHNNKLGEGVPVDAEAILEKVANHNRLAALTDSDDVPRATLLPSTILFDSNSCLMWYSKAQRRDMWFKVGAALQLRVWWPAVLFLLNRKSKTLYIFALASNSRPTLETRLYRAPFMNISQSGDFCLGGAVLPADLSASNIHNIEACLFESNFTHLNGESTKQGRIFSTNNEHLAYWREQQKSNAKVKARDLPFFGRVQDLNFK